MMYRAYLIMKDVKDLYVMINGNKKGMKKFISKINTDVPYIDYKGAKLFSDEEALFKAFQEQFKDLFEKKGINSWGELMSRFS